MNSTASVPPPPVAHAAALAENGFAMIPGVASESEISVLITALDHFAVTAASADRDANRTSCAQPRKRAGARQVLPAVPGGLDWIHSPRTRALLLQLLGPTAFAVRGLFFDKNQDANWGVPWHQDLSIGVKKRAEIPGFTGWSVKESVIHVQPPAPLLNQVLTLRLHLDDCPAENGALRVLPGTHRLGRIPSDRLAQLTENPQPHICSARAGDLLVMRPLLLHSSPSSVAIGHRRILHLEFAPFDLPGGLEWHTRIAVGM